MTIPMIRKWFMPIRSIPSGFEIRVTAANDPYGGDPSAKTWRTAWYRCAGDEDGIEIQR